MPSRTVNLLYRFLSQNNGQVSDRTRKKEFAELTDAEVEKIEKIYIEEFT